MLIIVPTPIGNLKDVTLRAIETLSSADVIICEDSRRASILLNNLNIKKPLVVLNSYNENQTYTKIINSLTEGKIIALISDSGTPLISDPGYKLVRDCLENGIKVDSLPGPTAVITALTLSGLPPDKFTFLGFLPQKESHRKKTLISIQKTSEYLKSTYVIYEAPHKLLKTLTDIFDVLGDIKITAARELTKIHQEVKNDKVSNLLTFYKQTPPKGEFVLLFNLD